MQNGYVYINRDIEHWEWYKNANTHRVFMHLLLTVNTEDGRYQGHVIKRGETVTGRKALSLALGLTESHVRTALNNLTKTGDISQKPTSKFTTITVCNWEYYNGGDDPENPEFNLSQEG